MDGTMYITIMVLSFGLGSQALDLLKVTGTSGGEYGSDR